MPTKVYVVPKIGDGLTPLTAFRPKYTDAGDLGVGWNLAGRFQALDYGMEDAFFLVVNATPEEHTTLSAQVDVLAVPNFNTQVSALALPTVQSKLESVNIPAGWVTTEMTYRDVAKGVRKIITFVQRFRGLFQDRIFVDGVTLNSRINQIPAAKRSRLADTADDLGLDRTGISGTTTIRQALRIIANQLPDVTLGGEQL